MNQVLESKEIDNYLSRLQFRAQPLVDRQTLDELIYLHQCSIPFETIDMHLCTEPPALDKEHVFNKLITQKRGGYCFELNLLFEMLLNSLGFVARPCLCRAVRGREGRMPINHRGILVELDESTLFADVGFGGPMAAGSLSLKETQEQIVRDETYSMRSIDDSWWALERVTQAQGDLYGDEGPSRKQVELELCMAAVEDLDFEALNLFFSRPGTLFHDVVIANLRTATGYYGLRENTLTQRENGESTKVELSGEKEFSDAVLQHFGFLP